MKMKNKQLILFILGMIFVGGYITGAHVDLVPWEEPNEEVVPKKSEPTVIKKPSYWESMKGWLKRKPKPEKDDEVLRGGKALGHKGGSPLSIEVAGEYEGGRPDFDVTPQEKAAIIRASNRGFSFFRKPTLKDEQLTSSQQALMKSLIEKIKNNPKYKLTFADMDGLSREELTLVEKIFNRAKQDAAREKKVAVQEAKELKKEEASLSPVEQNIVNKVLQNQGKQGESEKNVIEAVKLMKTTLATFKGKNVTTRSTSVGPVAEEQVTVAQLESAFSKKVMELPATPAHKAELQKLGQDIIKVFTGGNVPGAYWVSFRTDAGLSVDIMKAEAQVPAH